MSGPYLIDVNSTKVLQVPVSIVRGKKIAQQYRINETHSVELEKINRIFMFLFQIKYKTPLRTEPGS